MKQRRSFKNLPKTQIRRFRKERLEQDRASAKRTATSRQKPQGARREG